MPNTAPIVGPLRTLQLGTELEEIVPENGGRGFLMLRTDGDAVLATGPDGPSRPLLKDVAYMPAVPPGDALYAAAVAGTVNITIGEG